MTRMLWSQLVRCRGRRPAHVLLVVLAAAAMAMPGCALFAPGRAEVTAAPGPTQILADWDDLDAAVDVAAERSEMALVTASSPTADPRTRRFDLRTVSGEPAVLTVTRSDPTSKVPQALTACITVGRFGSPDREAVFLGHLKERLIDLRGVDYRLLR